MSTLASEGRYLEIADKETETFPQQLKNFLKQTDESLAKKKAGSTRTTNYQIKIL